MNTQQKRKLETSSASPGIPEKRLQDAQRALRAMRRELIGICNEKEQAKQDKREIMQELRSMQKKVKSIKRKSSSSPRPPNKIIIAIGPKYLIHQRDEARRELRATKRALRAESDMTHSSPDVSFNSPGITKLVDSFKSDRFYSPEWRVRS